MFWGKKKDNDAEIKIKMIRDLRASFPSLRRPNNDDTVFEIMFELNRQYHTLRVYLSAEFPASRPILQVVGDVRHPWLDSYKRVSGSNMLLNWSKMSSLSETVIDTLSALQNTKNQSSAQQRASTDSSAGASSQLQGDRDRAGSVNSQNQNMQVPQQQRGDNPPVIYSPPPSHSSYGGQQQPQSGYGVSPAGPPGGMAAYYTSTQPQQHHHAPPNNYSHPPPNYGVSTQGQSQGQGGPPPPAYSSVAAAPKPPNPNPNPVVAKKRSVNKTDIPPIPSRYEELDDMTDLQLEKLLEDEVALKAHVKGHSMVEFMNEPLEQLRLSNKNDAAALLELKDALIKQRDETIAAQTELRDAVAKYRERAALMGVRYTVRREDVLKDSQAMRDKLDLESEELADKFTNGEKDIASFLTEYMLMRTDYHAMNIKLVCVERDKS